MGAERLPGIPAAEGRVCAVGGRVGTVLKGDPIEGRPDLDARAADLPAKGAGEPHAAGQSIDEQRSLSGEREARPEFSERCGELEVALEGTTQVAKGSGHVAPARKPVDAQPDGRSSCTRFLCRRLCDQPHVRLIPAGELDAFTVEEPGDEESPGTSDLPIHPKECVPVSIRQVGSGKTIGALAMDVPAPYEERAARERTLHVASGAHHVDRSGRMDSVAAAGS